MRWWLRPRGRVAWPPVRHLPVWYPATRKESPVSAFCPHCGNELELGIWVELTNEVETVDTSPNGAAKPRKRTSSKKSRKGGSEYTEFVRAFVRGNYGTLADAAKAWRDGQRMLTP